MMTPAYLAHGSVHNCGRCHTCGTELRICLDGEEYCPSCGCYHRYPSHGWALGATAGDCKEVVCPKEARP